MSEAVSPATPAERPAHGAPDTLPRVLGLFDAVMMVVGGIIGSGIFFKAKVLAGSFDGLGSLGFATIMLIWVLVGLHTLCGSLSLGELAAMMPQAGGPYVYLSAAYGRLVAFLWGWSEFWIIRTASLGALSCATVIYLSKFLEGTVEVSRGTQELLSISIIAGLSIINILGTRWAANLQNVTVVIKVAFLAALVVLPVLLSKGSTANLEPIAPVASGINFWRALGIAAIAVLWPYDGWINIAPVAEEIREPQRNVPLALVVGILLIIGVYLGANIAYHSLLSMDELAASNGVAADACRVLFGDVGSQLASLGVMCSTFGAVNSNLITGPRIYFAIARDGLLPASVRRIHGTFQTPANAIILQAVWSILLVIAAYRFSDKPDDAFDTLTDFVIFGAVLFYSLVVASVFVLRVKQPELPRPYRTWGFPVTPAIYLAGSAGVMVSMLFDKARQTALGTLLILAGIVYFWCVNWWQRRDAAGNQP
jgi:basic amino acid/polyamine antiporter, APA family